MISNKAQEILDRVRKHLKHKKQSVTQNSKSKEKQKDPVNQDKTDPLFPNSSDGGPEAILPITGPQQGMLSTRHR